jgi:hypothetical protein
LGAAGPKWAAPERREGERSWAVAQGREERDFSLSFEILFSILFPNYFAFWS